ncbi:hypothetical protein IB279_17620 [Ensifer sp. ENS06]|uniref:hypothetical protein n=1 Tax=Ensifer sp. ENS06 TaxID=2769276 RepID=UPI0017810179|nr:hypothetical protein [Ensifer sp. ENS06]MBD9624763.1 hypothetical protein [Ensifer sp. ENS06]
MANTMVYVGVGATLEDAVKAAHDQIPFRPESDYTVSRVIDWGMQFGGFIPDRLIYVKVVQDEHAPFMTPGKLTEGEALT